MASLGSKIFLAGSCALTGGTIWMVHKSQVDDRAALRQVQTTYVVYTYVTVWCDFYGCFSKGNYVVLQVVKRKTRFLLLQKASIAYKTTTYYKYVLCLWVKTCFT